jgi:hypothetical protein
MTDNGNPMGYFREKILSVNADGGILFFDEAKFKETLSHILAQPDMKKRFEQLISLAHQCEEQNLKDRAVQLYQSVLLRGGISEYETNPRSDVSLLALKAYHSLLGLSLVGDECIWEECSQLIGDIKDIFELAQEEEEDSK